MLIMFDVKWGKCFQSGFGELKESDFPFNLGRESAVFMVVIKINATVWAVLISSKLLQYFEFCFRVTWVLYITALGCHGATVFAFFAAKKAVDCLLSVHMECLLFISPVHSSLMC